MRHRILVFLAVALGLLCCTSSASAQTIYTQATPVLCRSGELNCFSMQLKDDTGTVAGSYTTMCGTNALHVGCQFYITLGGVQSIGSITEIITYFPTYAQGSGSFSYKWTAGGLTGSTSGQGHWLNCPPFGRGQCAEIDSSTVTVN